MVVYRVALMVEFKFIEVEALVEAQAGSCVNTVDIKLWLRVMVLAFVGAVQLAVSAKTVVRSPVGHVGQLESVGHARQLELEKEGLPAEAIPKTVEKTVNSPEHDVETHAGQLELKAVGLPVEPF